jgi:hypothetical protein
MAHSRIWDSGSRLPTATCLLIEQVLIGHPATPLQSNWCTKYSHENDAAVSVINVIGQHDRNPLVVAARAPDIPTPASSRLARITCFRATSLIVSSCVYVMGFHSGADRSGVTACTLPVSRITRLHAEADICFSRLSANRTVLVCGNGDVALHTNRREWARAEASSEPECGASI